MSELRTTLRLIGATSAAVLCLVAFAVFGSFQWTPEIVGWTSTEFGGAVPARLPDGAPDTLHVRVADLVRPAVAHIEIRGRDDSLLGQGSGVVIDPRGYLVTNAHVVDAADIIYVELQGVGRLAAALVGSDQSSDLAVLSVDLPRPIAPAALGDSDTLRAGEWVLTIGSPFGLVGTVSAGIVSNVNRRLHDNSLQGRFIQTDAVINPGNSGGPLVNLRGEVVGINTAIATDLESPTAGFKGVGFAIPINRVRQVVGRLIVRASRTTALAAPLARPVGWAL